MPMLDFAGSNAFAKQTTAMLCHHASTVVLPEASSHAHARTADLAFFCKES